MRKCERGSIKGENLIAWRKGKSLSRSEAAEKLRIPFTTYKQYETDRRTIPAVVEVAMRAVDLK